MPPISLMCRSVWWAFAAGGAVALGAAAIVAAALVSAPVGAAAWQAIAGAFILVAASRSPGGIVRAVPFLGAAGAGIVLGGVGLLIPALDPRISLIGIGIFGVVAAAGYLAIARLARAFHVPDGGLYTIAMVGLAIGAGVSTIPAFGLGAATLVQAGSIAITGIISIVAATRLRILPDAAPAVLSHREARRRERGT